MGGGHDAVEKEAIICRADCDHSGTSSAGEVCGGSGFRTDSGFRAGVLSLEGSSRVSKRIRLGCYRNNGPTEKMVAALTLEPGNARGLKIREFRRLHDLARLLVVCAAAVLSGRHAWGIAWPTEHISPQESYRAKRNINPGIESDIGAGQTDLILWYTCFVRRSVGLWFGFVLET